MSVSIVQRLFAFFGNLWSFILTLVRSLLALFSFRRRSSDPLILPSVNRNPKEAFSRAHSRLRPILLTPRSIALSPAFYAQRAQSTRTRSATSTLVPEHSENATASASIPPVSGPQRTSPKLDPQDPELGLSVNLSVPGPPGATSVPEGTPDTSSQTTHTGSLSVLPLTPPDRCYLASSSPTDSPYVEPWPTNAGKPRLPGSPLKMSINVDSAFSGTMVVPIGSPPPGRWSPVQVWTSTPYKNDNLVPEPVLSPFDHHTRSTMDPSALANISHALISRSRGSIHPYDHTSNSSTSSDASPINYPNGSIPATLQQAESTRERYRTQAQVARSKNQLYPQFHHPNAYAYAWRRHGPRVPGKPSHTTRTHAYTPSYSHMDLPSSEWYDEDAYAASPIPALSPPLGDSATEDEDEVPLGRLRARMMRRSVAIGATIGLGVPVGPSAAMSPRSRRMSEGCLLAISELTPTRVGVGARSSRNVLSLALDGDNDPKDWLEALSLRFPSEQKEALGPAPEPCSALP